MASSRFNRSNRPVKSGSENIGCNLMLFLLNLQIFIPQWLVLVYPFVPISRLSKWILEVFFFVLTGLICARMRQEFTKTSYRRFRKGLDLLYPSTQLSGLAWDTYQYLLEQWNWLGLHSQESLPRTKSKLRRMLPWQLGHHWNNVSPLS